MGNVRRASLAAALAAAPIALAYRFALAYRVRAGYPRRTPSTIVPSDVGLPFEAVTIPAEGGLDLPGWFIPARDGAPGPGVVLVHGWESVRDRTLPMAEFLHAAGFHCLTLDVRGHGANPPERLPVSAGEFGADALAAFRYLVERPEVTAGAIVGHSMGGMGALLAAAADPRVAAVVATSAPSDPYRLTRLTFRLAHLPLPAPVAYPLGWLTTRVFLRPRGHRIEAVSAETAVARYDGPVLLAHGRDDTVVPTEDLDRLAAAARSNPDRRGRVEVEIIEGGLHSWLYEFPEYRRSVARFLAEALGGPYSPDEAGDRAAAVNARRLPQGETAFSPIEDEPGGFRLLAGILRRLPQIPGGPVDDGGSAAEAAPPTVGPSGPGE
jgi:alpha-beta hydrolase superfamily lysophospholipase